MENNIYNKILMIDDDKDLSAVISDMLEDYGYKVTCAYDSQSAFQLLSDNTYHLIILDVNLPDASGFEICRELRNSSTVPVIFASSNSDETNRILGYDTGGDDYIIKPYSIKEMLSRIKAVIRRTYGFQVQERCIRFGNVSVNLSSRSVSKGGKKISLSLREFDLLAYLCEHKNTAVSKQQLISEVWGAFSTVEPSTLTVHIRWLREKLEDNPASPVYIKTVYRLGYMLEV